MSVVSDWQEVSLNRVVRMRSGDFITAADIEPEGDYPVYGGNGLRGFTDRYNTVGPIVLVGRQGAHCGNVHVAEGKLWVSEHALRCFAEKELDTRWLAYAIEDMNLNQYSVSAAQPGLTVDNLKSLKLKLPPLDVQRRIAQFLDEKTARIDALIAKKRALLDRLAEKRQALITRAVTQGLNPDVPRKPSGIDWLGDIPAHWEVLPLRRVAKKVATGRTPPSADGDYFSDGEINWFTPGDFTSEMELQDSARKITAEALEDGVATLFPSGTIMLVGIGATLGKVAVSVEPGSANQQINAIIPEVDSDPYYLAYFLHGFRQEVRVMSNGNTLGILNQDGTKSIAVLRPPFNEQQRIAASLRKQDSRDADIRIRAQHSLDLLAEYRAALVTAAVTGQIEHLR